MQLPNSDELNIGYLSRLFDNTSECYKLFWFQAIMNKLNENRNSFTFNELVDEMIVAAWYMVTEYHLNLGPKDTLEAVVKRIADTTDFKPSEKQGILLEYLKNCEDKETLWIKRTLILNVPYRLLAPFMPDFKGKAWDVSGKKLAEEINKQRHLLYYFAAINGLQSRIEIAEEWVVYLRKNREIVNGWIQYKTIQYLQKRNPSVPGIIDKLYPPQERKLTKVIKYWKMVMAVQPICEIYGNNILAEDDVSIDHFIPWSYVAHDEFHKCAKEHLNNTDIEYRLYRRGQSKEEFSENLREIIFPVYEAARNSGFKNWVYKNERNDLIL